MVHRFDEKCDDHDVKLYQARMVKHRALEELFPQLTLSLVLKTAEDCSSHYVK